MLIRRLRVYPGINWKFDTHVDVYLDYLVDLTLHPHYTRVNTPPNGRIRGRSVPVHKLDMDIPDNLTLEPDSVMDNARAVDEQSMPAPRDSGKLVTKSI